MNEEIILSLKRNIEAIGRLLWEKDLVRALNGNISTRLDDNHILITATKTCLGLLQENDIVQIDLDGNVIGEGQASSERFLHTAIYQSFPEVSAVLHTHTTYTNAYFLENDCLESRIFESKLSLGNVRAIPQSTPNVTELEPVIEALKSNSIVVLKNHGVVAMGKDLFDCFLLIQSLEEAVQVDAISRLYRSQTALATEPSAPAVSAVELPPETSIPKKIMASEILLSEEPPAPAKTSSVKKHKVFSAEQISDIVRLINSDEQMKDLGARSHMTTALGIKMDEGADYYCFHFKDGQITQIDEDHSPEFLLSAPEKVWRGIFMGGIDPLVAITQKKMTLNGDFAKISQWYAPLGRVFELWTQIPVE